MKVRSFDMTKVNPRRGTALILAVLLCVATGALCLTMTRTIVLWEGHIERRQRHHQAELFAEAALLATRRRIQETGDTDFDWKWGIGLDDSGRQTGEARVSVIKAKSAGLLVAKVTADVQSGTRQRSRVVQEFSMQISEAPPEDSE